MKSKFPPPASFASDRGRSGAEGRLLSVIGTDTEVGKTVIAAALVRCWLEQGRDVGVYKPFASDPARRANGEGFSSDADLLGRAAGLAGRHDEVCGQHFAAPLAPLVAARLEGRRVDTQAALRQARRMGRRRDLTLVEGCGGWEVPLTPRRTTADFFDALGAPTLLVARAGLGTINHTLLTVGAIRARGLPILGVVLNRMTPGPLGEAERTNPEVLRRFAGLPVWGPIPFSDKLKGKTGDAAAIEDLPRIDKIAEAVLRRLQTSCR